MGVAILSLIRLAERRAWRRGRRSTGAGIRQQRGQTVAVLGQVLPPTDPVDVLQQHLDLAADEQRLEGRVVHFDVLDARVLQCCRRGSSILASKPFDVGQLALDRQGEGVDRALHALEQVDAHQVDEALLAVDLPEDALAAADRDAVLGVVLGLLVRQHVAQRRVGAEVQAPDLGVDLDDGRKQAGRVDVGLDVDRPQTLGEAAGLGRAVVLLDVLARAGDGQQVEQREVVEAEHVHQPRGPAFRLVQLQPAVELALGQPNRGLDAGDAVPGQRIVPPSVTKAIWFFRSARRLFTGVADSISTWVFTPDWMTWRISRS